MEMFTVSSMDGIMDERETVPKKKGENMKGLFPDSAKNPKSRPYRFNQDKKVIFFTSRVHPGETPGSHILNGALDIITDPKSEQGKALRRNFVFKVIPILNPDGVSRGYYRLDTLA